MEGYEIERKFLLLNDEWKKEVESKRIINQIYLTNKEFICMLNLKDEGIYLEIHSMSQNIKVKLDDYDANLVKKNSLIKFDEKNNFILEPVEWTTRIRLIEDINEYMPIISAEITIKGPNNGISKPEYNVYTDYTLAKEIVDSEDGRKCRRIDKIRNVLKEMDDGTFWEIDEFLYPESVKGLVLAEIEIPSVDHPIFKSDWVGEEVSEDPKYFNKNMK